MDEINPLSKFLSPLISFTCGKDTISVPGIVSGTIWGSFPVLGSFAVQFGDHLWYWDHLRGRTDPGAIVRHARILNRSHFQTGSIAYKAY